MNREQTTQDDIRRCNRCRHYFITHDEKFRYGCRALNFKSQQQPILNVIAASGQQCLYFEEKTKPLRATPV
jgi:hypothetical protein